MLPLCLQAIHVLDQGSGPSTLKVPGGQPRPAEGAFTGPLTLASLAALRFDTAIMGCCGLSATEGLTAYDLDDAAVKKAAIASTRRIIVAADGGKLGHTAYVYVGPSTLLHTLVTDATASAGQSSRARRRRRPSSRSSDDYARDRTSVVCRVGDVLAPSAQSFHKRGQSPVPPSTGPGGGSRPPVWLTQAEGGASSWLRPWLASGTSAELRVIAYVSCLSERSPRSPPGGTDLPRRHWKHHCWTPSCVQRA